jgi:glycosyltransferase involved in cell wall biosynthesis
MRDGTTSTAPRLSIGVPVYNGERYIARTLESLLHQTFRDFELIICDNGSTDRTADICREFAARDPRVHVHRAEQNLGVVRNFNRCVELARGELFHWHASDDMAEPTLLEKCVAVLDADPTVMLAFARTMLIDENDRPTVRRDYDAEADDARAHVRFGNLINLNHHKHCAQEVYGVIRRSALLRTPLYEPIVRTDSILLARLALLGRFRAVEEPLFLNREHEQRSVRLVPGGRAVTRSRLSRWVGLGPIPPAEFWDPSKAGKIVFPECARCHLTLLAFAFSHAPKLVRDIVIAIEHAVLGHPGAPRARDFPTEQKVTPA